MSVPGNITLHSTGPTVGTKTLLRVAALDDATVLHLDAVGKLLQSLGSDRFHGGDECRELVLGARRRALQTRRQLP